MTIPSIFREYLWLIKTIQNAGRISLREINQKWLEEDFSDSGAYGEKGRLGMRNEEEDWWEEDERKRKKYKERYGNRIRY